jgi:hypothetical protein
MPCLTLTVLLSLLALAVLAIHQYRRKRLTMRWWGAVLLAVFALASFPLTVITAAYFLLQNRFLAPNDLGLWIISTWQDYGRYASLVWVVGFPLVIKLKGVQFASARHAGWSIGIAIAIMLPLTLLDSSAFWASIVMDLRTEVSAVSPDGLVRVTAIRTERSNFCHYSLVSEENISRPWLSRSLATVTVSREDLAAARPSEPAAGEPAMIQDRLAWSRDSRVVALWRDALPMAAYDFSRGLAFTLSDPEWGVEGEAGPEAALARWRRLSEAIDRLMREHGGAADGAAPAGAGER